MQKTFQSLLASRLLIDAWKTTRAAMFAKYMLSKYTYKN
jgi:hypothetical protein